MYLWFLFGPPPPASFLIFFLSRFKLTKPDKRLIVLSGWQTYSTFWLTVSWIYFINYINEQLLGQNSSMGLKLQQNVYLFFWKSCQRVYFSTLSYQSFEPTCTNVQWGTMHSMPFVRLNDTWWKIRLGKKSYLRAYWPIVGKLEQMTDVRYLVSAVDHHFNHVNASETLWQPRCISIMSANLNLWAVSHCKKISKSKLFATFLKEK